MRDVLPLICELFYLRTNPAFSSRCTELPRCNGTSIVPMCGEGRIKGTHTEGVQLPNAVEFCFNGAVCTVLCWLLLLRIPPGSTSHCPLQRPGNCGCWITVSPQDSFIHCTIIQTVRKDFFPFWTIFNCKQQDFSHTVTPVANPDKHSPKGQRKMR